MSHAGSGAPRTSWGRAAVVAVGIPAGLAGLALGLTVWAPSTGEPAAAAPTAVSSPTPVSAAPPTPSATPQPTPSDPVSSTAASTGRSGRSEANRADPGLDVVWSVDTDDPVFFITVDDNVRDRGVAEAGLQVIQDNAIPVTSFLATNYVEEDTQYFDAVAAFGGSIQNHTVTHPFLNKPGADPYFEICTANERLTAQFGDTPWMMRPPYGEPYFSGSDTSAVEAAAVSCGVNRIVLWSVVVDNGNVSYNPSARSSGNASPTLQPGDIVLFHFWDPKFAEGLEMILDIGRANGLSPAPLEDYL